eukprot:XP_003391249.1 PREDICTED: malonate--CoA ligase-like [Amphimedon queenslandica]
MSAELRPVIRIENLVKRFGGFTALNGVSLDVYPGEVHALLGDNGAGKSTLIKTLAGVFAPTEGIIRVDEKEVRFRSPRDASDAGIGTVYQDLALNGLASVTRNFFMGRELFVGPPVFGLMRMNEMDRITRAEMLKLGIDISDPSQAVGTMSGGQRQTLAIARAIHFGAKVLILDEPTSALGQKQQMEVLKTIKRVRDLGHIAIILITHNEVHAELIADRFTFLSLGEVIGAGTNADLDSADMRRLMSNAETLHRAWGFRADDVLLHALPIFHVHGLFVACNTSLLNGSPMLFLPDFDAARICQALPEATIFMGVPTYYTRLLAREELTPSLCRGMRLFISGSAPLLEQTFTAFQERSGHTILERYGMTECGMSASNPLEGERRAGTVGKPLPGVDLRIVDDEGRRLPGGEVGGIEFKGPNVFSGYWRMPEASAKEFTADGYFRSGDLGYIDDDGYITIVGRSKDLIISGGLNIHPKEVELLIDRLRGVDESAVIGLPHPDFGEQVCAVVVPSADAPTLDEGEVIESLKRVLVNYKVPKRIFFSDSLPRNAMGKVQKNILRERFTADAAS